MINRRKSKKSREYHALVLPVWVLEKVSDSVAGATENALSRYWRGDLSLAVTIAIALIALRVGHYALQAVYLQPLSLPSTAFWLASGLLLLIWQFTGALRAVDRSMSYSGDMVAVYLCYMSMALVLALSVLQVGDAIAVLKQSPIAKKLVYIAPQLLPISEDGTTVSVEGALDFPVNQRLQETLLQRPAVTTVLLNSEGGRVFAARALAITVQKHSLSTRVSGGCHSACTLVFMAGETRSLASDAKLGFHRYSLSSSVPGNQLSIGDQLEKDRGYFLRRGASAEFVEKMFSRESDEIWQPSLVELRQAGVVNADP